MALANSQFPPALMAEISAIIAEAARDGDLGLVAVLAQSNIPSGIAPTGTVGANGALTLGTALTVIYSAGIWLFFPAGAVFSGSAAGSYWCVMSSTTAGTVFNNTKLGHNAMPTVLVPIVDAGPGAYTGAGTAVKTLFSAPIAGGRLGIHSQLRVNLEVSYNTTAGAKSYFPTLASTTLSSVTRTTTGGRDSVSSRLRMKGAANLNHWYFAAEGTAAAGASTAAPNIDMAVDQTFSLTGSLAVATDWIILESYSMELLPTPQI